MDYKLVKQLGLQVFSIPQPNAMLVCADDLEEILRSAEKAYDVSNSYEHILSTIQQDKHDVCIFTIKVRIKPKSTNEKILDILNDHTKCVTRVLQDIRDLIQG